MPRPKLRANPIDKVMIFTERPMSRANLEGHYHYIIGRRSTTQPVPEHKHAKASPGGAITIALTGWHMVPGSRQLTLEPYTADRLTLLLASIMERHPLVSEEKIMIPGVLDRATIIQDLRLWMLAGSLMNRGRY